MKINLINKMSKKSQKEENLVEAFAGRCQANRRFLYFEQKANIESYNDVASIFRLDTENETGDAHSHLECLEKVDDLATGKPIGENKLNFKFAVTSEIHHEDTGNNKVRIPDLDFKKTN